MCENGGMKREIAKNILIKERNFTPKEIEFILKDK